MIMYTEPMAKTVPVRELRSNLSSLLDDASDRRDHVLVTRNGAPAAALVPIDEYEALKETPRFSSDPDALAALETGSPRLTATKRSPSLSFAASWPSAERPPADRWPSSSSPVAYRDRV
jgi:antitoxin YefM